MQHYIFTKTFIKLIKNQNTCVYQQLEVAGFFVDPKACCTAPA